MPADEVSPDDSLGLQNQVDPESAVTIALNRIRSLEAELVAKERVIRGLDQAARERLALINRLTGRGEAAGHGGVGALTPVQENQDPQLEHADPTSKADGRLLTLLGDRAPGVRVVDVGALFGALPMLYAPLLKIQGTEVIGFEPLRAECDRLNGLFGPRHKFLPYAVGDGRKSLFYRTQFINCSSLLEPDLKLMSHFQNLADFCRPVATSEMITVRLDDVPEARGADYIKIDVQGAEDQVLAGAHLCLDSVLALQTEIEFLPIYKGQPLFGDLDATLRSRGFMFHRFTNLEGRTLLDSGFVDGETCRSQQLFGDAMYIRPIDSWGDLTSDRVLKLALILDSLCGSRDFCASLLQVYDRREGTDLFHEYIDGARGT